MNSNEPSEAIARLHSARGFLFDLDGTLVLGDKRNKGLNVLPGAAELLQLLQSRQIPYAVMTNGTVSTPSEYNIKLRDAGLEIPADRILTPSTVAAEYFLQRGMQKILVLGVEGVWRPLQEAGLEVILPSSSDADPEKADAVFVGWYREFHMDEIEAACQAVWNGAELYAASLVLFFATRDGRALGSSRAISAMITSVTDIEAKALGKPSLEALKSAARILECGTSEIVVVGDDPELEILMAHRGGALAVGVHSGIGGQEQFESLPDAERAHLSLGGIADLYDLYAEES
jgi:NagD protein